MRKLRYRVETSLDGFNDATHKEELPSDLSVKRFIDYAEQPFWQDREGHDVILDTAARSPY